MNPIEAALVALGLLAAGALLGGAAEYRWMRPWKKLANDQAAILHTDDRTPRHPFRSAGPDDFDARNQVGRRS